MEEKLVDIFIIGAQKAGTSSLQYYLGQHPSISTNNQEMMYFLDDRIFSRGYKRAFNRYFPQYKIESKLLAKNVGVLTSEKAQERLYQHNPNVKVLITLRNPIDRIYSAYWYNRRMGWENINVFENAIFANPNRHSDELARRSCDYIERSLYAKNIKNVYSNFPKSNVYILIFEELMESPYKYYKYIFSKLDVSSFIPDTTKVLNKASMYRSYKIANQLFQPSKMKFIRSILRILVSDKNRDTLRRFLQNINKVQFSPPPMLSETREILTNYFDPYNQELQELLGIDLAIWKM